MRCDVLGDAGRNRESPSGIGALGWAHRGAAVSAFAAGLTPPSLCFLLTDQETAWLRLLPSAPVNTCSRPPPLPRWVRGHRRAPLSPLGRRDVSWGAGQQTPRRSAPPASAVASFATSGGGLVAGQAGEPCSGFVPSPDANSSGVLFLLPAVCFP